MASRTIRTVLVVNSGSSSLKYMLFDMKDESMLCKGIVERIGMPNPNLVYEKAGSGKIAGGVKADNHGQAFEAVCGALLDKTNGVVASLEEIEAIGHRVLHGGEEFSEPVLVNTAVKDAIRRYFDLGPLHNPANLQGIEACEKMIPGVPNVAVFDTAFHKTMPRHAYLYAIPLKYYEKYGIRKYGFHGTSHKFVTEAAAAYLKKPLVQTHDHHLPPRATAPRSPPSGTAGSSTPPWGSPRSKGLIMGTRSGDIDPAVCFFLAKKEGSTRTELDRSSTRRAACSPSPAPAPATCATSSRRRRGRQAARQDRPRHVRPPHALYIGGYYTLLGGVDAIVFTGGIGENSHEARKAICRPPRAIGVKLDDEKLNKATRGRSRKISAATSKTP
jgi:acetate kinase